MVLFLKICLISPPKLKYFPGESTIPPVGLACLAGVLEKNGIEVKIIDAAVEKLSAEDVIKKVFDWEPEIIGITASTPAYPAALETMKGIKKMLPETKVILGGSHGTFKPEDALKDGFDIVIRGEGEFTLLELCRNGFSNLKEIRGLSFREEERIFHNENREFIKNIDELPFPSYHLLPFDLYQKMTPPSNVRKGPWMSYYSSRGCPFGCIFCSVTTFWGRMWRGHSAERMIDDIEKLIKTYRLRTIYFLDDNFTFNKKG